MQFYALGAGPCAIGTRSGQYIIKDERKQQEAFGAARHAAGIRILVLYLLPHRVETPRPGHFGLILMICHYMCVHWTPREARNAIDSLRPPQPDAEIDARPTPPLARPDVPGSRPR